MAEINVPVSLLPLSPFRHLHSFPYRDRDNYLSLLSLLNVPVWFKCKSQLWNLRYRDTGTIIFGFNCPCPVRLNARTSRVVEALIDFVTLAGPR
jgi:hypothetical protein